MHKQILLYYKYVTIDNPETVKIEQQVLCKRLKLTGRIIIATEGINGTVCGSPEETEAYIACMRQNSLFTDVDFKTSTVNGAHEYFPKLQIVVRPEIVHTGLDKEKYAAQFGGKHLTPDQAHALLEQKPEDLVVLDGRNDYEARVGKFVDAVIPPIDTCRDFPTYVDQNIEQFKDKQVLMYCTGGVRCERLSSYLKEKGIAKEVYQIEGGIHRYVEKYPDGFFRGKNYVFDARVTAHVNDDVLSLCDLCNGSSDDYTNCKNALCNKQYISCPSCTEKFNNCCSQECHELLAEGKVPARPYRPKVNAEI